jgi:hypothetical protein
MVGVIAIFTPAWATAQPRGLWRIFDRVAWACTLLANVLVVVAFVGLAKSIH